MASSPDGNGVLLFGGCSSSLQNCLTSILELRSDGKGWVRPWTTLTAKLQYARRYQFPVIPVYMEIDTCELNV